MVLKIHGNVMSTCTKRILLVLEEKNIEYEVINVSFSKHETRSEKHLKMQPFGKVPVLEDDGFFLFESRAIAKYIMKKYADQGTKLMPTEGDGPKAYGLFEQACSIESSYFDPSVSGILNEKVYKAFRGGGPPDEAHVKTLVNALDETFAVYDKILAKQEWLAGDEISFADLCHIPVGNNVHQLEDGAFAWIWEKHPNVKRWWNRMVERDSWKKVGPLQPPVF